MSSKIVPSRSLLLLLDLQVITCSMIPSSSKVIASTVSAISTARRNDIQVAHCRMGLSTADASNMPPTNATLSSLAADPERMKQYHEDSPDTAFQPDVAPNPGDLVMRKNRVGVFMQDVYVGSRDEKGKKTNLKQMLREKGVDTLIIGGIATGGAVLATVVQAADLDFKLVVLEDCCADRSEELHRTLTEKIFAKRGMVLKSGELQEYIE